MRNRREAFDDKTPHALFEDEDEDLDDLEDESGRGDGRGLSDLLRKAVTGVGAVMTNDETSETTS